MQIARIRLSDKTSRLHPRHVVPKRRQAYEPEVPVQVREWIGPALASPDLVLDAQPPAQPLSGLVVDRPVRFGDGAYFEVVRPHRSIRENVDFCGGDEQSLHLARPSQTRIATRSHQRRCQAATAFCSIAQVAQAPSPPRNCGLVKFEYVSAKCTELLFKICFRRRTVPIGQCQRDVSPISGR